MSDTAVSASATEITFRHSNDQRLDDLLTRAFLLPYASTPSTPADGPFDFHPSATAPCLRDPTRGFHPFPPYPSRSLSFPLPSLISPSRARRNYASLFFALPLACQRDAIAVVAGCSPFIFRVLSIDRRESRESREKRYRVGWRILR